MTNKELWEQYSTFTNDLSTNARKFGYAAVGILWILKGTNENLPENLLYPLGFIAIYFLFDILQYFSHAIILKFWIENEENKLFKKNKAIDSIEYNKPKYIDIPSFILFVLKIIFLIIGYSYIGIFII